ncbi:hypothetical protein BY996DRAFT_6421788 [Phakopsora pachyrhizi]|nr:hypothetical protein BY996DRAFT_6421788 [Phakopsora pachyrhizi]
MTKVLKEWCRGWEEKIFINNHKEEDFRSCTKFLPHFNVFTILFFRREIEELMNLRDTRSFDQKVLELEVVIDNIGHQANHLNELASLKPTQLIVPINLRAEPSFKDSDSIDKSRRRKVFWATVGSRIVSHQNYDRFMDGPPPSRFKRPSKSRSTDLRAGNYIKKKLIA